MPSDIYFAGEGVRLTVVEDPVQVAEAFASAGGLPFRLTSQGQSSEVYVNPAMVAFWSPSGSGPEPVPPPDPPPTRRQREPVTDIWGKPVRKKRRE